MGTDKVIRIDFRKGKKSPARSFFAGPRLVAAVMVFVLALLILATAAVDAAWIATPFFGPTAVVLAVLAALLVRRLALSAAARRMAREAVEQAAARAAAPPTPPEDDPRGRTLH